MAGGNVGSGYVGGSGGSGGGGGVGAAWVDENYVSKAFFNQLFAAKGLETVYTSDDDGETWTQDGDPTEITFLPNEIPSEVIEDGETAGTKVKTVRSLRDTKSLLGLWTDQYLSALGRNSSSGGGGGGGVTSIGLTAPTGFTVNNSPITSAGTIQLGFATGYSLPTNAKQSNWDAAYNWGNHANAGYLKVDEYGVLQIGTYLDFIRSNFTPSPSHPFSTRLYCGDNYENTVALPTESGTLALLSDITSALTGYATQGWVNSQGFLKANAISDMATQTWVGQNYLGISATAAAATKLATARSIWGQSFDGQADITGNMSNVGNISFIASGKNIGGIAYFDTTNGLLGIGKSPSLLYKLDVNGDGAFKSTLHILGPSSGDEGGQINLYDPGNAATYNIDNYNSTMRFFREGGGGNMELHFDAVNKLFEVGANTDGSKLRIGNAILEWVDSDNLLKLHKSTGSNDAVNFCSMGAVSALGKNSSGGGGGGVVGGQVASFTMQATGASYWHKIGTYVMNGGASVLIIDVFSGFGYNGFASQNSWARIMIKKSNTSSGTSGAVGVTCEQFGPDVASQGGAEQVGDGMIRVAVRATSYNSGEVWVKTPWGYPQGSYTVQGNFGSWSHNSSTIHDTTTSPHNQNAVGYFNNTSAISYN